MPEPTTADDMLEAAVMMQEELLEAEATRGAGEGKRYQAYLEINGEMVPVIDQPEEEKFRVATEAVANRAEKYEEETFNVAKYKLSKWSEVEAVDHIADLPPGDKDIYLRAEREGKNRKAIFEVFGNPEGE